ncbi:MULTISPECIES: enoyl-CoA hydratase/isomerase family protein [unclassified Rhodococcus (in: high G+C Gram-positive bacteria)]|uniref:enoyl-CoA hydratase/isomerase family protein n=1 Tax=unclassified Rhodococcus (in: high G+C Gram-positive bacteria) TaxID=192944 RepID=UPI0009271477|nr:enoyl-CoA hydratase/isomerase family protein [Rhodococcus sp. M8]OLL20289.1 enoyl-CoA hydratase [Rhodococcus sp. M8]
MTDWSSRLETLKVTADGPVRIVTMNRPDARNAADAVMHRELAEIWDLLAVDPGCRVVVLTGAGKAFSAGGDLPRMVATQEDPTIQDEVFSEARRTVQGMMALPQPLIAAVNGAAVGLGASLISLCDLVIASDRAFLADPHLGVGLVPADGAALLWPLIMGTLRAKEYVFTGERITAPIAKDLGLVNRVVEHEDLMPAVMELAHKLAAVPHDALRQTKRLMSTHTSRALAGLLDDALAAERASVNSAEHRDLSRALVDAASARQNRTS